MTQIGHNNPPDPIDTALEPFGDWITEAENWLDGEKVSTEEQMKSVDSIHKEIKAALKAVKEAEESETKPLYDAWKKAKARWKPTIDDLTRIHKGLAAIVGDYKKKLAAEKEAARRKAWEEAERKRREAEEAARKASEGDIESQREAARIKAEAKEAERAASHAQKDKVKGLRTKTTATIINYKAVINHIAKTDREAVKAFCDEWVAKQVRSGQNEIPGVDIRREKYAV